MTVRRAGGDACSEDTLDYAGSWAGVTVNLLTGEATGGDALGDEFFDFENLSGSAVADRLTGNALANRLTGGDGDDTLTGGVGADSLSGGLGADRFVFQALADSRTTPARRDRVEDFSRTERDRIDLSAIDADPGLSGNQAFSFLGTAAFTGSGEGGEVRYERSGGNTFVYADADGDAAADLSIRLEGLLTLRAGDFVL